MLEHQTARHSKLKFEQTAAAKVIMQRLGPGRRAKHLELQTVWVQQLAKIGLISLNNLVTLENVTGLLTEHIPRTVLAKLAAMMGYTFPSEETAMFQTYTSISQNYWDQRVAAVEKLLVFDDEENEKWENEVRSFLDKTTHLTTAILMRGVEMSML